MSVRRLLAPLALLFVLTGPVLAQSAGRAFDPDTVRAGRLDGGKMWLFEAPPFDYLRETYGFRPDSAWFQHARLAALRLPGCSASFVSPNGLVATNHHCIQGNLPGLSRAGESLLNDGFSSRSLAEECPIEGSYVDQLQAIEDVTAEIRAAVAAGTAEREATAAVQRRLMEARGASMDDEAAPWTVQVARLYDGARYSAYVYRRYHDLRLVFAPESRLGFFGGDADNFTYPRYALDFSLLRVYGDDGRPMSTPTYFPLSREGVSVNELIFVIGNPGSTSRALTRAQLEVQRDVNVPTLLSAFRARTSVLRAYLAAGAENHDAVQAQLFGLSNSEKIYEGRGAALRDDYFLARREAAERTLVAARPEVAGTVDSLRTVAAERRALGPAYRAFAVLYNPGLGSALLQRAEAARMLAEAPDNADAREALMGVGDRPTFVERGYLAAEVAALPAGLQGASADAVADRLLASSALVDSAGTRAAVEGGRSLADDPAVALAMAVAPDLLAFRTASTALGARERALAGRLGLARYAAYGTAVPPDATFSLRFTDGVVRGYPYNGTMAPPFTTMYGLFDRSASFPEPSDWTLPDRWIAARDRINMGTPLDFTSTSDTIGGNSGSPVVNRELELVGLNFDRTIEGLIRDYAYMPDRGRNVMVDARAVLESLRSVYDQQPLVDELTTGTLRR